MPIRRTCRICLSLAALLVAILPSLAARDVLRTKGYEVNYTEYAGGHGHANWQATLPEELVALLGKR